MIGEFLYGLSPMEAVSAPVMQRRHQFIDSGAIVAVSIANDHETVPLDKIAIVKNICIEGIGGAAQNTISWTCTIIDASGNNLGLVFFKVPDHALALLDGHTWTGELILFPGEHIRARATFSAGGVANQVQSSVHMFYLPKGTLQLR